MWGLAITLDQKQKSSYLEIGACRDWATQFLITRMYKQLLQTTKIGPGGGNRATQFVAINPQLAQLGHATAAPSGWQRARQAQIAQIPAVAQWHEEQQQGVSNMEWLEAHVQPTGKPLAV
jgi:hypothetical protein